MATDLTRDEQALLEGLEALFHAPAHEPAPNDLTAALQQQVRDRLAPDHLSAGETMAVTLVAVVILGLIGVHRWSPFGLVASGVTVWVFVRATFWVGSRSPGGE